eukprot:sb/3473067/
MALFQRRFKKCKTSVQRHLDFGNRAFSVIIFQLFHEKKLWISVSIFPYGKIWYGSVRFGNRNSVRFGSVKTFFKFGSVRFGVKKPGSVVSCFYPSLCHQNKKGIYIREKRISREPTESSKQPIKTRYLGHMTGYQAIREQYFLIRSVPDNNLPRPR